MNTKIEEKDGKLIATLEGEMDTAAATEAEEVLKPLFNSNGNLLGAFIGASFIANDGIWTLSYVASENHTPIAESVLASGVTIVGTCYGKYTFGGD